MTHRAEPAVATGLRLFLDTADRAAWARWLPTGLFHGITTNPLILQHAGLKCRMPVLAELVRDALSHDIAEVMVQTWGREADKLVANGRALAALDARVVIKVPLTLAGVNAVKALHQAGVRTTLTACYAAHQALTAAAAGADYLAPYFGRIGDGGRDALAEVRTMQAILAACGGQTRLIVASIRRAADLPAMAASGMNTFTFGPEVAAELFADTDTEAAAESFEVAAES